MEKEKRLIDANALLGRFRFTIEANDSVGEAIAQCVKLAAILIKESPTVDAVEVVRCKDCKWAGTYVGSDGKEWVDCTYHHNALFYKDNFCSHGQRRAE